MNSVPILRSGVLILILLDVSLGDRQLAGGKAPRRAVLILILLDVSLGAYTHKRIRITKGVLILILLDVSLGDSGSLAADHIDGSLNPYSTGC